MPDSRTVRIGLHARNDIDFPASDYLVIKQARIETLKVMSFTQNHVFERLRRENPELEFIVRLHDSRIGANHPTAQAFAEAVIPRMRDLKPFTTKFEIHNEPNHHHRHEGWGSTDDDARSFRNWYLAVLERLRDAVPWARLGFPGLAPHGPHRDLEWLEICADAVEASDWLGCHTYWQYDNVFADDWGLRFKHYHAKFPDKIIEITEFGNSTPDLSGDTLAQQYVAYYEELFRYSYLGSACAFIASSSDPQWARFVWRKESGEFQPVVRAIGAMARPPLVLPKPVEAKPAYKVDWLEYTMPTKLETGQQTTVRLKFRNIGSETWGAEHVQIGYRWYTRQGEPVIPVEDQRTNLPADMMPGMIVSVSEVRLAAPPTPGEYILKWDLIQDNSTWFCSRGSPTLDVTIQVEPAEHDKGLFFEETRCTVKGAFLKTFTRYGREVCGYPITDKFLQDGIPTQYFQNVALEEYEKGKVRFKEVGSEAFAARARIADLEGQLNGLTDKIARLETEIATLVTSGVTPPEPPIENVTDSLPHHPTKEYDTRSLADIQYFVVHHTAVPAHIGPEPIARYQVQERDWPGIGYHFVVMDSGVIYQTNRLETISYHARSANPTSVGIALSGNFMKTGPTRAQVRGAAGLLAYLMQLLRLPGESIKGHKDFVKTQCPGDQWDSGLNWRETLLKEIISVFTTLKYL